MTTGFERAAILGATGPTGIHLVSALRGRISAMRVVSRSARNLERAFPGPDVERVAADVLDESEARRAVSGCDVVFDCIGLPAELMDRHAAVAENVASAVRTTGARAVQISSYWAYLPLVRLPLEETHPREGGPPWVRHRRDAEDRLQSAGAAIVHLPDFYGPHVHVSTLQNALREAVGGGSMNWIGGSGVAREYAYVKDAMRTVAELAHRDEAYGERFVFPGAGPLTGERLAAIASGHLGRNVKLRAASPFLLRMVALFDAELRSFLPMVPHYVKPLSFDPGRLEALLGPQKVTPYAEGVAHTLDWIRSSAL